MTLRTVLLSLQALLAAAEPDDPQDAVVANQVGVCLPLVLYLLHLSDVSQCCSGSVSTQERYVLPSVIADWFLSSAHTEQAFSSALATKNYPNAKCVPLAVISEVCVWPFCWFEARVRIDASPMCHFSKIVQYKWLKFDYRAEFCKCSNHRCQCTPLLFSGKI